MWNLILQIEDILIIRLNHNKTINDNKQWLYSWINDSGLLIY